MKNAPQVIVKINEIQTEIRMALVFFQNDQIRASFALITTTPQHHY